MAGLSFVISSVKSLKVIGRNRLSFHLDQLVIIGKSHTNDKYFWVCGMGEVEPHRYGTGLMCEAHGMGYLKQIDAEEDAVAHLVNVHRASGGGRRPKGRARARQEREIAAWNARHVRERD